MPPLCVHLSIAKDAADRLRQPIIEQNRGLYFFGATLPDIHFVTGDSRGNTHFFDLVTGTVKSGVSSFLQTHPELNKGAKLNSAAKTVVAGYLSHLIVDELWVVDIYRPFFGPDSPLKGDPMANVLDRAFQFELDRRERLQQDKMRGIRSLLAHQNWEAATYIADVSSLKQWQEFLLATLSREPSWKNFPSYARSFLLYHQKIEPGQLEKFIASLPGILESVLNHVSQEKVESFKEKAISVSAAIAKEYMD